MSQWEYQIMFIHNLKRPLPKINKRTDEWKRVAGDINSLGLDGWELVEASKDEEVMYLFFKRQIGYQHER